MRFTPPDDPGIGLNLDNSCFVVLRVDRSEDFRIDKVVAVVDYRWTIFAFVTLFPGNPDFPFRALPKDLTGARGELEPANRCCELE